MLTGSAYMREPRGVSKLYAIDDPEYRGVLFIPKDRLLALVRTATECGLQFTAHTVGDGAVHTLLGVYEELAEEMPIREIRHSGCGFEILPARRPDRVRLSCGKFGP